MDAPCKLILNNDEGLLTFMDREGTPLPAESVGSMTWDDIDTKKLPVCVTVTTQGKFALILYNKEQFHLYFKESDGIKRHFYLVDIEKLWDVSNLNDLRYFIESDRVHSKLNGNRKGTKLTPELSKKIAIYCIEHLNRDVDARDIAGKFGVNSQQVFNIARNCRDAGAKIPESYKKGIDYITLMKNVMRSNPELVDKKVFDKFVDKHQPDPYQKAGSSNENSPGTPVPQNRGKSFHCLYCEHTTAGKSGIYQHTRKYHPGKKKWK